MGSVYQCVELDSNFKINLTTATVLEYFHVNIISLIMEMFILGIVLHYICKLFFKLTLYILQ